MGSLSCFVGGRLVPRSSVAIPSGLRLGDGVYETFRTYHRRTFRLEAHLDRMLTGARSLELEGIPSGAELRDAISMVLDAGRHFPSPELVIRPIIAASGEGSELLVLADPFEAQPDRYYTEGMRAAVARHATVSSISTSTARGQVKTLSHGPNALALRRARRAGVDEAIFMDGDGRLVEGSRSNLLVAVSGTLLAPGPASGALDGVTRGVVLESARGRGLHVEDRAPTADELGRASEALLTSSLLEVAPLVQVDSTGIGSGTPGVLFKRLREGYLEIVARECGSGPE